ncbi:tRNA uridine(34) 5-carboxymethylaminomethyl modification radical SAM/GNAT enzyme Elp3 [Candidatus Micrarchaeota archaeon]|nr:tRNA uridine(34) 5-carboxymethylaminomethyl modification radical SAM/GNAT enzyme Elp3 [Candidatus Micrarchaeota archaeon]MBD3417879.1 tRNA uridine(34) 5-carboxymethylaminomethyl modification radical SAM/GNAT enzyme Elp3 [Candidatus Micrarchaeota archaeon]
MRERAARYAVSQLLEGRTDLHAIKQEASKKFRLTNFLRNSEILAFLPGDAPKKVRNFLLKRPMRTASGVTPVALMIKPEGSCGHSCIYCPYTGKAAKSYTGEEPAALRARQYGFDAFKQVEGRLRHFLETGHPTDKCEAILMGGTFLSMPEEYKRNFVKNMYDGFNRKPSRNLAHAKKLNESAKNRVIGLTIETRPDICKKKHIDEMLEYGATRVELGVQFPDDRIYRRINRGHTVKDVVDATRWLKDSCFKVAYHIMPGLPGSSPKKDNAMVKNLFQDAHFKPDMLKIYPTLVMPNTQLYKMMEKGEYTPYSAKEAADVISEFYRHIPPWVRVMRIQRDIPSGLIGAGVEKSNLRELVEKALGEKKIEPNEIRCREVGRSRFSPEDAKPVRIDYQASRGKEIFLSYEAGGRLIGFLRLRIPFCPFRREIGSKTALVRELHIYGAETSIGKKPSGAQHRAFGSLLLEQAESIASEEFGKKEMIIISGIGARQYYSKRGYKRKGPYMHKSLR